jgi:hypothetical protein
MYALKINAILNVRTNFYFLGFSFNFQISGEWG